MEDYDERPQAKGKRSGAAENLALSAELCAVMAEFENTLSATKGSDEEPECKPKIFYASRTHSQLAQLIDEVKKTEFGSPGGTGQRTHDADPVRTITLGSRKQMCINADVQRIGATLGVEAMNERCLELMESGKEKRRCPHLPPMNTAGEAQMDNFRDHALAEVQDIEELVSLGKRIHVCPYFGSRRSIRQAELVALPYNLLLQADARDSLNLDLEDSIIIIDEAHNLIDTLLSTYSAELSAAQVEQASSQVAAYLARFSMRLKGLNEEHLRTLRTFLDALAHFCAETSKGAKGVPLPHSEGLAVSDFIGRLGGTVDQINVRCSLERGLRLTLTVYAYRALAQRYPHCSQGVCCPRYLLAHHPRSVATRTNNGRRNTQIVRCAVQTVSVRCMRSRRFFWRSVTALSTVGSWSLRSRPRTRYLHRL